MFVITSYSMRINWMGV